MEYSLPEQHKRNGGPSLHLDPLPRDDSHRHGRERKGFLQKWNRARRFFEAHTALFAFSILIAFLFSVLYTLRQDGLSVFESQRAALVLEVFSRTDLPVDAIPLLEEGLRAIDGVKEVVAVSPDESLQRLAQEPNLPVSPEWLQAKTSIENGAAGLLPWTYRLHLNAWDEATLNGVLGRVEMLEVGVPKLDPVAEVHYDRERWSLTVALYHYVKWLGAVLAVCGVFLAGFLAAFVVKTGRWIRRNVQPSAGPLHLWGRFWPRVVFGVSAGIIAHFLFLVVLSQAFYFRQFSWEQQAGHLLLPQIALSLLLAFLAAGVNLERD